MKYPWLNRQIFCIFNFYFLAYFIQHVTRHCFICQPSDSAVSEDAGIEPRNVATHTRTNRLDLIHSYGERRKKSKSGELYCRVDIIYRYCMRTISTTRPEISEFFKCRYYGRDQKRCIVQGYHGKYCQNVLRSLLMQGKLFFMFP